ncbi:hypothetical protein PG988_008174 [Apiospora saccharicola]
MDAYKRAGRGGAGNYYSPQQIEEATNSNKGKGGQQEQDLEAQKPAASSSSFDADPLPSDPATAVPVSAPPPPPPNHQAQAAAAVASSRAAAYANAHAPPPPSHQQQQAPQQQIRYSGRGGAGNWTSDPAQLEYDEENKRKRQAALDAKVFNEVNTALAEPKKAYQLHPAGHIGRGRVGVAGQGGGGDVDGIDI